MDRTIEPGEFAWTDGEVIYLPEIIARLIDEGADIGHQNQWGRAPLHVAVRRGCAQVARLLIERGADLHATTNEGWTPLHVAYRSGHPRLVKLLRMFRRDADELAARPMSVFTITATGNFRYGEDS